MNERGRDETAETQAAGATGRGTVPDLREVAGEGATDAGLRNRVAMQTLPPDRTQGMCVIDAVRSTRNHVT